MTLPALSLRTAPPTSTPLLLKPMRGCGRAWNSLTEIKQSGTIWKVCQVILRIVPALFVILATIFASTLSLGCIFPQEGSTLVYKANGSDDAKRLLRKLDNLPRDLPIRSGETPANLQELLPKDLLGSPVIEETQTVFTEDAEKEKARKILYAQVYPIWKIDLPVKRNFWPLGMLFDAFRGPISNQLCGDDILDFVLGVHTELEPEQLKAAQLAVQSASKIQLLGTKNLQKMEVRLETSSTFY